MEQTKSDKLITQIRILNSSRELSIQQVRSEAKWLDSSLVRAFEYIADEKMWEHVDCGSVVAHAANMAVRTATLREQNLAMRRLHDLSLELEVAWPDGVEIVALVYGL